MTTPTTCSSHSAGGIFTLKSSVGNYEPVLYLRLFKQVTDGSCAPREPHSKPPTSTTGRDLRVLLSCLRLYLRFQQHVKLLIPGAFIVMASPDPEGLADDDIDAQAMAEFLGFSSFGAQEQNRPSKKRRFNSHADDAVIAGIGGSLPAKPPKPASSGANSLPVHPRVVAGASSSGTSGGSKGKERQITPENSNEIGPSEPVSNSSPDRKLKFPHGTSLEVVKAAIAARSPGGVLPDGCVPNPEDGSWEIEGAVEPAVENPRGRVRGSPDPVLSPPLARSQWYDDYYDRNSNENPWERLENARGLGPIGPWPPSQNSGPITAHKLRTG